MKNHNKLLITILFKAYLSTLLVFTTFTQNNFRRLANILNLLTSIINFLIAILILRWKRLNQKRK